VVAVGGWVVGLCWFVSTLDISEPPDTPTDAIVVLTGGSLRIDRGLTLLREGKARHLLISGVNQAVAAATVERLTHAEPALLDCCVVLGHDADNTEGNAREAAEWVEQQGYGSLRLVTANYHMPRALIEFRRILPRDIQIIPDAVIPEATRATHPRLRRLLSPVVMTEYSKYLLALLRAAINPWPPVSPAK
jgi:uncharacterized SAM-binding protein YcdF (DUF218 family)